MSQPKMHTTYFFPSCTLFLLYLCLCNNRLMWLSHLAAFCRFEEASNTAPHAHMAGGRERQRQFEGRADRPSFFFLEGRRREHLLKRDIDIPPFPSSLISAAIFHLSLLRSLVLAQKPERGEGLREGGSLDITSSKVSDPPLLLVTRTRDMQLTRWRISLQLIT